jgi:IS6 family transposase
MMHIRRSRPPVQAPSTFTGFRFPPVVILLAVRWYMRYALSCRVRSWIDESGITIDHVTLFWWVQRLPSDLIDAARPSRHQGGPVARRRDLRRGQRALAVRLPGGGPARAGHRHPRLQAQGRHLGTQVLTTSLLAHRAPAEVITDRAPALANVIEDLIPAAFHNTRRYENNGCECDQGGLKARPRPLRGED